jgi:hypothetical protein
MFFLVLDESGVSTNKNTRIGKAAKMEGSGAKPGGFCLKKGQNWGLMITDWLIGVGFKLFIIG